MELVISTQIEASTCRYTNARHGLNSAHWGSLFHEQMDKPPDERLKYFHDIVPSMLTCTIFVQMKPFVIELLLGLAPVWKSRRALEGGQDSSISTQNFGSRVRLSARTAGSFRVGRIWASLLRSLTTSSLDLISPRKTSSTLCRRSAGPMRGLRSRPSRCASLWRST